MLADTPPGRRASRHLHAKQYGAISSVGAAVVCVNGPLASRISRQQSCLAVLCCSTGAGDGPIGAGDGPPAEQPADEALPDHSMQPAVPAADPAASKQRLLCFAEHANGCHAAVQPSVARISFSLRRLAHLQVSREPKTHTRRAAMPSGNGSRDSDRFSTGAGMHCRARD